METVYIEKKIFGPTLFQENERIPVSRDSVTGKTTVSLTQIRLVETGLGHTSNVIYCHIKLSVGQTPRLCNLPSKSVQLDNNVLID